MESKNASKRVNLVSVKLIKEGSFCMDQEEFQVLRMLLN